MRYESPPPLFNNLFDSIPRFWKLTVFRPPPTHQMTAYIYIYAYIYSYIYIYICICYIYIYIYVCDDVLYSLQMCVRIVAQCSTSTRHSVRPPGSGPTQDWGQHPSILFYPISFYSIVNSILFYSTYIKLHPIPITLYYILFHSILFHSVLFNSTLSAILGLGPTQESLQLRPAGRINIIQWWLCTFKSKYT